MVSYLTYLVASLTIQKSLFNKFFFLSYIYFLQYIKAFNFDSIINEKNPKHNLK